MYKLERLLVALDLTEMDDILIRYISKMAAYFNTEKVYFFHIADSFNLPAEVKKSYPDLLAPTDESIRDRLEKKIEEVWNNGYSCEKIIEIKDGNPAYQLLRWVDIKCADLIVLGRKKEMRGEGVMAQKIAKVALASVLLVPENLPKSFETVLVPVNFSKHSRLALEEALELTERTGANLKIVHVFKVPSGYYKTGKSKEEFAEVMRMNAEKEFKKFVKRIDFNKELSCDFIYDADSPADTIFRYACEINADLIIMGSKGRTGIASLLLGSITEKVITHDADIPVIVVKEKGENMGFLKALMQV